MTARELPRRPGQDRKAAGDAERALGGARAAAISSASSFTVARAADWAGTAPTTLKAAIDRLAYHIASGGGTAPIVELP